MLEKIIIFHHNDTNARHCENETTVRGRKVKQVVCLKDSSGICQTPVFRKSSNAG